MGRLAENKKYQYGYQDLKNIIQSAGELSSPGIKLPPQNTDLISPVSPRRVEFADQVFAFSPCRPSSRAESPNPRGILRHTMSDPQRGAARSNTVELGNLEQGSSSRTGKLAVRSNTTDLSLPLSRPTSLIIPTTESSPVSTSSQTQSQPLVKILLPDDQNDSDDTLIEEKHETEPSKEREESPPARVVPPRLADWNRTQSFPPARQVNRPELITDQDLIRGENSSLRVRVLDLEQQVHDNNDEIKCLRATLAECLRKVGDIETKIKQSEFRPKRRDPSEGSKSKRNPYTPSSNFGSQDFSGRATFEMYVPPQRGTYTPRQR